MFHGDNILYKGEVRRGTFYKQMFITHPFPVEHRVCY